MKESIQLAALLASLVFESSIARATQTTAPMRECPGCSATAMQTMAKNQPVGYAFIYDLAANVIRKYDVYLDSTCGQSPLPQSHSGEGRQTQSASSAPGTDCGSFKAADLVTPVNPDVQDIFNSLRAAWVVNPTLVNTAKATRQGPPINPDTGQPFNLSQVAWDYPQGSYITMKEYIRDDLLGSRLSANSFVPGLGDFIFGVSMSIEGVDVGNPPQVLLVHISLDRGNATVHLDICDANGVCSKWDITIANGQVSNVIYNGTFDVENMMLPSQSGQTPGQLNAWHWQLGTDADHFGQMLGQNAHIQIPIRPGCGQAFHWGLVVARVNGAVDSATWQCVPNN